MTVVYVIFVLLAAYYSFRYDRIEVYDSHKMHRFWLLCGYLVCLAGLRYGVGGDTLAYMSNFENIPTEMSYMEYVKYSLIFSGYMPGWTILVMWIKRTFDCFYVLQFVQAAIVNISFCYFALRYTKRVFLFFLLYFLWSFFFFNTEVMREAIAVSFCMFGMEFYLNGKKRLFIIFTLIGLMFHMSAVIALVFPFANFSPRWRTLLISIGIAIFIWLFSDIVMGKFFVAGMGQIGAFGRKMMHYSIMGSSFYVFFKTCLKSLVFPFIIMYFSYLWESSDEIKLKKKKLMSFAIFLGVCISSFEGLYRFWSYIQIFHLFFLADFIFTLFKRKEHLIIRSFVICGTLFFILRDPVNYLKSVGVWRFQFYVPYTSIVNENTDVAQFRGTIYEKMTVVRTDENTRDIENPQ